MNQDNKYIWPVASFALSTAYFWYVTGSPVVAFTVMVLIAIHEFGHYFAGEQLGEDVTLPIFTPIGAFISLRSQPTNAAREAYLAIAGPAVGSAGALLALLVGVFARSPEVVLASYFGLLLNLFNLIPWSPMDGGRIAQAISRHLWVVGAACLGYLIFSPGFGGGTNSILFALVLYWGFQDIGYRNQLAEVNPGYYQIGAGARLGYTAAYLGLAALLVLTIANYQAVTRFLVTVLG